MARQGQVLYAVMLRNIRTRFFGNGLGYLVAIAWPLVHILVLIFIFSFTNRAPPVGESTVLFVATGTVPFMTFNYLSRFMQLAVLMTKPLLSFPEVRILDVLLASAALEFLASCSVTLLLLMLAWFFGVSTMPRDLVEAASAFGAAALLGLGFGLLNGVVTLAMPMWMTIWTLLSILLWISSGVAFVPDAMPESARYLLSFLPTLQIVEWMRSAYYEGYGSSILDRGYTVSFGVVATFLGLLAERGMRGHLLVAR